MKQSFQSAVERLQSLGSLIVLAFLALLVVIPFRYFVAEPFIVAGASMDPLIKHREYIVIDHATYFLKEPERGDVVIFRYPLDPDTYLIKRVIGLPGEAVTIKDGVVTIEKEGSSFVLAEPYAMWHGERTGDDTMELGKDEYYVMGDNRLESADSRVWGPLQNHYISGRAFARLLPFSRVAVLPGEYRWE